AVLRTFSVRRSARYRHRVVAVAARSRASLRPKGGPWEADRFIAGGRFMHRRLLGVFALAVVVSVSFIAPAGAQQGGPFRTDRRISVTGGVVVAEDEVVDGSVLSVDGPVTVNGTVDG